MAFWIIHSLHRRFVSCELFVQNRYDIIAFWLQWMENVRTSYVGCRPVCQRLGYTIICSMSPFWLCGVCVCPTPIRTINKQWPFQITKRQSELSIWLTNIIISSLKTRDFCKLMKFSILSDALIDKMFLDVRFLLPTYVTLYALEVKIPWIR